MRSDIAGEGESDPSIGNESQAGGAGVAGVAGAAFLRLVAITDSAAHGIRELPDRLAAAVSGGATSIQIRLKDEPARSIVALTREVIDRVSVPVTVNDRFDIALAAGAHGVHLGADDISPRDARRFAPPGFLIGTSVGCVGEIANAAGADYVGIGPVYVTASKSDAGDALGIEGLRALCEAVRGRLYARLPVVAIGGITPENAGAVVASGVTGVAVISAVLGQRDPARAAMALIRAIGN